MTPLPDRATSPRLMMRQWTVDDIPALSAAVTESLQDLLPWMPWAAHEPLSVDDRRALIETWQRDWESGGGVVYGVFSADGTVLGGTGFPRRAGDDGLEIGYWIHSAHVGNGYAQELARALTDLAFTVEGIERVEIHHDRANVASGRVPEALGYTMVEEHPREITAPGECGITFVWRVERTDWESASRTS